MVPRNTNASRYTVSHTLHRGDFTTVYRALRSGAPARVILKVIDPRRCASRDLERLRHEYEIGASLETPRLVRPLALDIYQGMPALVLEDWGGEPLSSLAGAPMPPGVFLKLAMSIASAVAELHREGVIHKDLKPEHILVDTVTKEAKLVDLGIASRLPRERQAARPPQVIEGSLPYLSPEQTGRMNRVVDSRSDLYSLGVVLYQMLTGRLPFDARDPLEWVHCHVSRIPPPPSRLVPEIPEVISRIVMKLLAKMAEDRYQTANGLRHDLARCLEQWRRRGQIRPFALGTRDVSDRLQIPQKLYGREEQIATLLRAFERVADSGTPELVLVTGYSGIGKSSLVHEVQKPIVARHGLFVEGKFDQQKRDIPYSTLARAFGRAVLDLLVEGEERTRTWKERFQAALGANGQLVVDVIPEVEVLVGKQPPVPEVPPSEARSRFQMVFRRFLGALAREEQPLVLFLDDLQWADAASLDLLANVLTHPETRHLLTIGAYRNNEVTAAHPLMTTLGGVRETGFAVHELVLSPLSREHLCQLVAEATRRSVDEAKPLALLVGEKTAGNPYFVIQFLTSLQEDGLLRFDPVDLAWRFDVEAARARGYTDSAVELMLARLHRLPPESQEAVSVAACVGTVADAGTVAIARGRTEAQVHADLWALVREGLLARSGEAYAFAHDRVREAAYALLTDDVRVRTHLAIGRLLLAHAPGPALSGRVFDIVNQLNRAASLIREPDERRELAELNLLAGRKAKASAAYGPAAQYLAAGASMLTEDCWQSSYELSYALHLERAQCEYLAGRFADAEEILDLALLHARTRAEKAALCRIRIEVYTNRSEPEKAVDALLDCAALFGVALERHPQPAVVQERHAEVLRRLGGRSIEALLDLAPMADPDVRALAEALVEAIPAAYQYDMTLDFAIISEAVRLSIEHGTAPCSAGAYNGFGNLIGPLLGLYRDGARFAKLAHALVQRHGWREYEAAAALGAGYMASFWTRHVGRGLSQLEEGLRAGVAAGTLTTACYCAASIVSVLLARGDDLESVERQSTRALAFLRDVKYASWEDIVLSQRRLIRQLRGVATPPAPSGAAPEDEGLDERVEGRIPQVRCFHHVRRLQERFLLGEHREALTAADRARDLLWSCVCWWERCEYSFFFALTLAALLAEASPRVREEYLRALRAEVDQHRVWTGNCPENFAHRLALLRAELARITGDQPQADRLYDEAIRSAHENGFVQDEALAYELASRFYRTHGRELVADGCLREARACYLRWGADAKVKQIDEMHPGLLETRAIAPTATITAASERLDLLSVVKASQTISGEMEIPRLIGTLLQVALEQGGARRGCLLLERDGALFLEAEASMEDDGVLTRILPSVPAESSLLVPLSVVHYARVTRQPVIVEDMAADAGKFSSDAYFSRHKTRSVLCLPILQRADLVGLLYLENRFVAGAFTPDRLTALSLLAAQAAISVENALHLARERTARTAAEFHARAAALLAGSLEFEETLAQLSRLCVRSLADWCMIDLVEGREIHRLAGACADPAKEPVLDRLRERHPARWDSVHPAARSLRTGEPVWVSSMTDDLARTMCEDDEHLDLVRALGTRSILVVPLVARRQTLGILTLCSGTPGRYGRADLELAQELAQRAAIAIDNARLYREAQRAVRLRDEFLLAASHELRTPLTSLGLSLRTLQRWERSGEIALPARVSESVELAARQGTRLNRLVGDLLDVSRIETRSLPLELAAADLRSIVREVARRFEADLAAARCTLSIQCDGPVTGRWDASRLDQVVTNLLSNAIKFGAGAPIEVEVAAKTGWARLSVRDHGIGIDPAHQARIFEAFERAAPIRHFSGLGLGLFISRRIVEAHGGTLRVESVPGEGSTFIVDIPHAAAEDRERLNCRESRREGPGP